MQANQIKIGKKIYTVKKQYVPMLKKYKANKRAKIGEEIVCPVCGVKFIKKTHSHSFDSISCKNSFWNKIDPRKRNRKNTGYNRYQDLHNYFYDEEKEVEEDYEDDFFDWDVHDYHIKE